MAVTVYKSNDPSAPLLDNTLGSYNKLLKACLVDGYGSKLGSGWTMPYDDIAANGQSIFANASGKNFLVQHDEFRYTDGTTTASYRYAFIRGCASYTDWNTTTGNFPNIISDANPDLTSANFQMLQHYFSISESMSSGIKWHIIADDKTVYIITKAGSYNDGELDPILAAYTVDTSYNRPIVFGDYGLLGNSTNAYNSLCGGVAKIPSDTNQYQAMCYADYECSNPGNNQAGFLERNIAGDVGAVEYQMYPEQTRYTSYLHGALVSQLTPFLSASEYYIPMTFSNVYTISRIMLYTNIAAPENVAALKYPNSCAGYYRGLYCLYNNTNPAAEWKTDFENGDTFTSNGRDYYVLLMTPTDTTSLYTYLFDLTGWD